MKRDQLKANSGQVKALIGQATDEQIAAWKKENPQGIYQMEADGHVGYFKNPTRVDLNCSLSKADRDATMDMFEDLADSTWLGGSEELLTDDWIFSGVAQELKKKMEGAKVKMVNL